MPGDDLIQRAQAGDAGALEQLCSREWRPIYAIVYATTRNPHDAEDLTQEVFFRALKAFDRCEQRYVPFRAYLATVARNLVKNRWRRKVPVHVGLDDAPQLHSTDIGPEENAMMGSDLGRLADVFSALSSDYQRVLQLRMLEGCSSIEVAERMQRTPAAVRVLQHRALVALRSAFNQGSRMNAHIDELDRLIDALNVQPDPEAEGMIDADLGELIRPARDLKEPGHTRWPYESFPARAALNLATRLGPTTRFAAVAHAGAHDETDSEWPLPPLPNPEDRDNPPLEFRQRQPWMHRSLEIAAAAVVLVAFTVLVAVLLGYGADSARRDLGSGSEHHVNVNDRRDFDGVGRRRSADRYTRHSRSESGDLAVAAIQRWVRLAGSNVAAGRAHVAAAVGTDVIARFHQRGVDVRGPQRQRGTDDHRSLPYQDSAQTMPPEVWDSAVPIDLSNEVKGKLYQSDTDLQLWWQHGPTSIRLESGGAPGTSMLTEGQLLAVASSMWPLGASGGQSAAVPAIPASAKIQTADQEVARARTVIGNLKGNSQATASKVTLATLSDQTNMGMPQPNGIDPNAPIWVVQFDDGLSPLGCPSVGTSVCNHGQLVVVLDADTGQAFGFHGVDGVWKQP